MNLQSQQSRSRRACFFAALLLAVVVACLAWPNDRGFLFITPVPVGLPLVPTETNAAHIVARSPGGQEVLIAKTSDGDLWLRDRRGHERCVGSNVVRASFSPDGKKLAIDTKDNEIVVETIDGDHLARLTRASDHAWSSNSAAIVFSAMASADYPQLEQTVVYDLDSNRLSELK